MLEAQVDMVFADLRTLLRLPIHDLTGCNLTAGAMLFNLIAGSSVCFFEASKAGLKNGRDRGRRFCTLINDFFPREGEKLPAEDIAETI